MINFKNTITLITLLALAAGCGSAEEQKVQELPAVPVSVAVAKSTSEGQVVQVSGRIEAASSANVSTRMMGNVSRVLVNPGDAVKKGDLLVAISSADLSAKQAQVEAAITQAESGYENAKKDYERFQALYEKGSASEKELENMTTRYEMAKAGLEQARQMKNEVDAQFAYTNIRAPFTGVVANIFVKVGDIANPGMPLAVVEGTSAYEAAVMIPESQVGKVKEGAKATVLIKSKNLFVNGTIKEVSPSAKLTGGQFLAKIILETSEDILPGMFVNASIEVSSADQVASAPLVSQEAIVRNGQLTGVYALGGDNNAILRWVRLGQSRGNQIEVLSGLSEGETYITKADGKLFNGAKVALK